MAKVVSGTKARRQQVNVLKAVGNNVSKIRCPCGQLAHPASDGKGGQILLCTCGKKFTLQAM